MRPILKILLSADIPRCRSDGCSSGQPLECYFSICHSTCNKSTSGFQLNLGVILTYRKFQDVVVLLSFVLNDDKIVQLEFEILLQLLFSIGYCSLHFGSRHLGFMADNHRATSALSVGKSYYEIIMRIVVGILALVVILLLKIAMDNSNYNIKVKLVLKQPD